MTAHSQQEGEPLPTAASFEDGLGVRLLEDLAGERVERLIVRQELVALEPALRDRVSRLANFRHIRYPRVRGVESSGQGANKTVSVVADLVDGIRLSTVLDTLASRHDVAIDINGALQVARELLPALAVLHDSRNVSHGAVGPERVVLNRDGRIVVADHVFGLALERLKYPRSRLWREFRIAMPPSAGLPQFDPRADIAQVALLVFALLLGRSLAAREFPDALRTLLAEAQEPLGGGASRPMTASLRGWFERALPIESRKPFASALEAQIALEGVITREIAYAPRPGSLRSFVEELTKAQGDDAQGQRRHADRGLQGSEGGDGAQGHGGHAPRKRHAGGRVRGPSPEEVEAEEIRRLEAELQRLIDLEQQPAPVAQGLSPEPTAPAAAPHDTPPLEPQLEAPQPGAPQADVPQGAQDAGSSAGVPEGEGEDELVQLTALAETFADHATQALPSPDHQPVGALQPAEPPADIIEISLDDALEALVDDPRSTEDAVAEVAASEAEATGVVAAEAVAGEVAQHDLVPSHVAATRAADDVPEQYEPGAVSLLLLPPPVAFAESLEPESDAQGPVALVDELTTPLPFDAEPEELYETGTVWLLLLPTPSQELEAAAADAAADAASLAPSELRDDLTLALPFDADPEPVALETRVDSVLALAIAARARAWAEGRGDDLAADLRRVQRLWPRAVPSRPATAVPLRRIAVPRKPAALGPGPVIAAALAAEATPVFAAMALYEPAGALVAPPAAVAPVEVASMPASADAVSTTGAAAVAHPVEPALPELDAVAVQIARPVADGAEVPIEDLVEELVGVAAETSVDSDAAFMEVETLLAELGAVEQDENLAVADTPVEEDAFAPEGLTLDLDDAAFGGDERAPAEGEAAVVYDLGPTTDAPEVESSPRLQGSPEPSDEEAADAGGSGLAEVETLLAEFVAAELLTGESEGGIAPEASAAASEPPAAASVKRRRRRKGRKSRPRVEVESPPVPEPVRHVAPWLRGAPGTRPADVPPTPVVPAGPPASLSDPVAPLSTALPPWARRGREPVPVVPLGDGQASPPAASEVTAPLGSDLAPVADAVATAPEAAVSPERPLEALEAAAEPQGAESAEATRPPVPTVTPAPAAANEGVEPPPDAVPASPSGRGRLLRFPALLSRRVNWRRTAAAAIVLLLIEGVALATAYWLVTPREMGFLVIHTSVPGVDVLVDGQKRGRTPAGFELAPGRHTIELKGFGTSKVVPVEITDSVQTTQSITWPKPASAGSLRVSSSPPGALISIDGEPAGPAPVTVERLAVGTHTVVAENDSGTVEQTVRVRANELTEIDVPIYSGWLVLFAPVEVRIFLQGRMIGTSLDGRILMPPGRHQVELVNTALGYREARTVVVTPGRVTAVSIDAPRGAVAFDAPDGTEVWVDGDRVGVTPLGELSVPVGTHEVTFKHPQLGQRRVTVVAKVGAPSRASMLAPR